MKKDNIYRWGFLVGIILLSIYGTWRHMDYRIHVEDDLVWSYQMSANFPTDHDLIKDVEEHYLEYLEYQTDDGQWKQRAAVRAELDASKNYLAGNIILFMTAKWIQKITPLDPHSDYPAYIAASYLTGFILQVLLVSLVAFLIIYVVSDLKTLSILSIALIYILISDYFEASTPQDFISQRSFERGPVYAVGSFVKMMVAPLMAFSPFYPPFKSRLVLLVLTALILRWRGHTVSSYWCLVFAAFFHQGYGGIVIMFMVAVDVIKRPELFKQFKILLPAAIGILSYIIRDGTVREALSAVNPYAIYTALLFMILTVWLGRNVFMFMREKLYVPLAGLLKQDIILTDIIVLAGLWLGSLLLFIPISLSVDPLSSSLLWGQVHGRLLGVFHPAILFAAIYALFLFVSKYVKEEKLIKGNLAILMFCACISLGYAFAKFKAPSDVYANLNRDFAKLDALSQEPLPDFKGLKAADGFRMTQGELVESIVYYSMAKSKELDQPIYSVLFKRESYGDF